MNALEQQLNYPLGDLLPEGGTVHEVASGVFWVRMPLPFALDHINLWLLRDEIDGAQGWTIVDCGIAHPQIKAFWEQVFDKALDGLPVLRVIVTHCHPDHLGLAHWICEGGEKQRWHARLWMSLGDYAWGRVMASANNNNSNAGGDFAVNHFIAHGLADPEMVDQIRNRKTYYSDLVPSVPSRYRRMCEGDAILIDGAHWDVVTGYGHSPEHVALYSAKHNVLISGDMVLPRISTNVSVFDIEPEANPLQLFLDSLGRYLELPADCLTLPSHGKPFTGLHTRIGQLRDHHAARLQEVREACAESPQSAADIVPIMFRRKLDAHQTTFAIGEALAHLHLLWHAGEVTRTRDETGIWRFSPTKLG
ncbi:Zn-dependent hydrolase [Pandoraea terrae]|uniref:Zn-dependent hydrolase n=1 Tax=Pandoraea terrae TaxID=1537710 RepID=A0A5E4V9A3_9BURK|nr:MBL fold metallo-hydrolase [Pandoraea terrae]VVE08393.1 Zn-dependent hydrolase [Pandoraea terrae]